MFCLKGYEIFSQDKLCMHDIYISAAVGTTAYGTVPTIYEQSCMKLASDSCWNEADNEVHVVESHRR